MTISRTTPSAFESELAALGARRGRVERQLEALRSDTTQAVLEGHRLGISNYRMAQLLGIGQMQVGRILKATKA